MLSITFTLDEVELMIENAQRRVEDLRDVSEDVGGEDEGIEADLKLWRSIEDKLRKAV